MSTELIRWLPDTEDGGFYGCAGKRAEPVFRLYPPNVDADCGEWLLSSRLTGISCYGRNGEGEQEMKARAEEMLREFVTSLGAVFPGDLRSAPLPGFVPAAALRSELDLLASQHQALGDAKHGQPEALEHLGRAAAFDQVKEILNSLEATR